MYILLLLFFNARSLYHKKGRKWRAGKEAYGLSKLLGSCAAQPGTSASIFARVSCDVMTAQRLRSLHWEDGELGSVGSLWVSGPD